jgi:transposase
MIEEVEPNLYRTKLLFNNTKNETIEKIRQWIKRFPKNLHKIRALIKEEFDIEVSKETLKRALRSLNFRWHRIRRKVKGKPDPKEYAQKKEALEAFKKQEDEGLIDVFYYDESGFCLVVPMP